MTDLEIFVVDDDAPVRRALDRLLRVAGYRVRAFASAHDVLEELPNSSPACMIIDVRMPDIADGAFAEALSASDKLYTTPIREGLAL